KSAGRLLLHGHISPRAAACKRADQRAFAAANRPAEASAGQRAAADQKRLARRRTHTAINPARFGVIGSIAKHARFAGTPRRDGLMRRACAADCCALFDCILIAELIAQTRLLVLPVVVALRET